jgi:P-loop containing dynein motor region
MFPTRLAIDLHLQLVVEPHSYTRDPTISVPPLGKHAELRYSVATWSSLLQSVTNCPRAIPLFAGSARFGTTMRQLEPGHIRMLPSSLNSSFSWILLQGVLGPCGAQRLLVIVDDLNATQPTSLGIVPPLELIKQWVDHGFW